LIKADNIRIYNIFRKHSIISKLCIPHFYRILFDNIMSIPNIFKLYFTLLKTITSLKDMINIHVYNANIHVTKLI